MDVKRLAIVVVLGLVIGGFVFGAILLLNPKPEKPPAPPPAVAPALAAIDTALLAKAAPSPAIAAAFVDPATPKVRQAASFNFGKQVTQVAFTRDSRLLLCMDYEEATLRVLDWRTGNVLSQARHGYLLTSMALAPDGTGLWTGDAYQHLYWWPLDAAGKLGKAELVGENLGAHPHVATSPNGALVATASFEKVLSLWDTVTRKMLTRIEADEPLRCCTFSPDGKTLLVGTASSHLYVYDLATGKGPKVRVPPVQEGTDITALAYSRDGKRLATSHTQPWVTIWDAPTMTYRHWLECPMAGVRDVEFTPDGNRVAFALGNNEIHLWNPDVRTDKGSIAILKGHEKILRCLTFSPNGTHLASGDESGTIILWTRE